MMTRRLLCQLLLAFSPALLLPLAGSAAADGCGGGCCGPSHHCPSLVHCTPKVPCIKFKRVCPKPICNPCELEGYGYYETCWHSWPFPPRYAPCDVPGGTDLPVGFAGAPQEAPLVTSPGVPVAGPQMPTSIGSGSEMLARPLN